MNLRDSMVAAVEEAPLSTSTTVVDEIIAAERRSGTLRRAGVTGAALAVAAVAVAAGPALLGDRTDPGPHESTAAPPAAVPGVATVPTTAATGVPRMKFTAAQVRSLLSGGPLNGATPAEPREGGLLYVLRRDPGRVGAGDPCVLPAGATPGVDGAPVPADRCEEVRHNGRTAWVRTWGYDARYRPGTTPETSVIEVFYTNRAGERRAVALSNVALDPLPTGPQGVPFEIEARTVAEIILDSSLT